MASSAHTTGDIDLKGGKVIVSANGDLLYTRFWAPTGTVKAVVLFFHGLGEHICRYDHVFSFFASHGYLVKALDYRGHGRTHKINEINGRSTVLGYMGSFKLTFDDMLALYNSTADGVELSADALKVLPTFVYGHSLGGLVALSFVKTHADKIANFKGIIASAPAVASAKPTPAPIVAAAKAFGTNILEKFNDDNKLDLNGISTDPAIIEAYKADPFVHGRISLRAARDIFVYGDRLMAEAPSFVAPIYIAHSPNDLLTSFDKSKAFFERLGSTDKTFREFPGLAHELHNEPNKDEIIAGYLAWLDARV
ncbi:hypothetical protein HK105_206564 [Polyrhizophydium stewartii]|uniref:Serine aminopeptidase S33 domain-containing protein n=1 Tax=Polyrhizophydium stewartii TaxID=2732419 RepID=A0ABR4N350_9FUNG|nr:hypothetical protein HK105_007712 [Polyrhizophydium stewartii]